MNRRTFVLGSGIGAVSCLAGCLTDENEDEDAATEEPEPAVDGVHSPSGVNATSEIGISNDTESDEQTIDDRFPEAVDPTVLETYSTEPRLVNMNERSFGEGSEFTVTIQNTGIGGDIGVEFYWVQDTDQEWKGVENAGNRRQEGERITYFDANERRSVSFVGTPPYGYEGYAFDLFRATFAADIRNDGGSGDVEVKLTNPDVMNAVTERRTVSFDGGETKRVEFAIDQPQLGDAFNIEAESALSR